jgi:hypothetical protein
MTAMSDDPERQVSGSESRKAVIPNDESACQLRIPNLAIEASARAPRNRTSDPLGAPTEPFRFVARQ